MNANPKKCSECGGEMEKGAVLDFGRTALRQRWLRNFRFGWLGIKTDWAECRLVDAYRCKSCGYLKFYATAIGDKPTATGG